MHIDGQPSLDDRDWQGKIKPGSYSDSKLFITALALAVARLWPDVISNAVDPGWVPTKMGGVNAPDDLQQGHLTQEWLATSSDIGARVSGAYWYHMLRKDPHPTAADISFQNLLLRKLEAVTGVSLPRVIGSQFR